MPARQVEEAISLFSPRLVCAEAASFARAVTTACRPATGARAKALLFACSRLAQFGLSVGLEPRPEVLLHPSSIERFVLCAEMSEPTRRTVRANLRHAARRVLPPRPDDVPLPRERAKSPYSEAEIACYLALADAQPTDDRRLRAGALICLGAGAGLRGSDLRHARGTDVQLAHGGLLVEVGGSRPRSVPVLAGYHERLLVCAAHAGDGYLIGGENPERLNVTSRLTASLAGGAELARIDLGRLRATWLRSVAEAIGLRELMAAAGVSYSQRLGDIVSGLEPPDPERAVWLLGARC